MLNKYLSAIIAGAVFGVLIGITAAIPCLIIISFVLMVALGALTVYIAREDIRSSTDALVSSGFAGAIAGIVGTVVAMAGLTMLVIMSKYHNADTFTPQEFSGLGIFGMICCAPVLLVAGVLLSAIGGYVFYELAVKRTA